MQRFLGLKKTAVIGAAGLIKDGYQSLGVNQGAPFVRLLFWPRPAVAYVNVLGRKFGFQHPRSSRFAIRDTRLTHDLLSSNTEYSRWKLTICNYAF
jgi:hypothetical protein